MRIYLSGGMDYKKGLGNVWRENITKRLEDIGYTVFDPVAEEKSDPVAQSYGWKEQKLSHDLTEFRAMVREKMFRKDARGIQLSQLVVLLYDESVQRGAGSLAEAWEAFREARPLYIITNFKREEVPGWLIGESTAIFRSPSEVLDYLKDKDQVKRDIKEARKARDTYLGEIYEKTAR